MDNETLKQLKNTEIEILDVFDYFCREHNIQYSLYAGTALGAIRHGGFIPWDDDIDIAMSRIEYDRFAKEWGKNPVLGYYFENYITDRYCGNSHSKLRKNNTLIASKSDDLTKGHHGIWVDIFPFDKLSDQCTIRKKTFLYGKKIILLSRANIVCYTDNLKTKVIRKLLTCIPYSIRHKILTKSDEWLLKNDKEIKNNFNWVDMSAYSYFDVLYPQNLMDETIDIKFEDKYYKIFKNYDDMLRRLYGDYMKLPPIEQQVCTHRPIKIQF